MHRLWQGKTNKGVFKKRIKNNKTFGRLRRLLLPFFDQAAIPPFLVRQGKLNEAQSAGRDCPGSGFRRTRKGCGLDRNTRTGRIYCAVLALFPRLDSLTKSLTQCVTNLVRGAGGDPERRDGSNQVPRCATHNISAGNAYDRFPALLRFVY